MKKRMRIVVPLLVVAALATWWLTRDGGEATDTVAASGTVEATEADLGFQMPGRLQEVAVREGESVEAGAVLARLDTRELEAVLAAAHAQLRSARARLTELEAGSRPQEIVAAEASLTAATRRADEAERNAARVRMLFEGGAVSRQALDGAETALAVARAERERAEQALALAREGPRSETVGAQRAQVAQAEANVARAEASLEQAQIVAPFAGVVTVRHREPGEIVAPGAPVLTLLDRNDRWVRIYVREDRIGRVQIGAAARIASDSHPDRTYEGEVVFVGSEAEFTPRNVQTAEERVRLVYAVKVRITGDPGFDLKPGTPADVVLDTGGA